MAVISARREPVLLETVDACPLCGGSVLTLLFECKDRQHGGPGVFGLCRCEGCGCGVLTPRPTGEELFRYYPQEYSAYGSRQLTAQLSRPGLWKRAADRGLRLITVVLPNPTRHLWTELRIFPSKGRRRVLDIGCGDGRLLEQDVRAGWEGVGIDFSARAVARGRARGLDVRLGALEEVYLPSESFDLVRLSHVIEHVPNPRDLLRRSYELLRPGGRAHVVTPNFASPVARLAGRYWYDLDSPRHLVLFTPGVLRDAAERVGFIVEKEAHEALASGSWRSIALWFREQWPESQLLVGGNLRFSDLAPRLLYPVTWALALLKRGERMHLVLRKPLGG